MSVNNDVLKNKNNEIFYKNWDDYHLKNTSVYNVRIKHVGNYRLVKEYKGRMLKTILSKREIVEHLTDTFGEIEIIDKLNNRKYSEKGSISDEIREDNYHRSHELLLDLTYANYECFTSFITLTFKDNITDVNVANKEFNNYCLRVRKVFPNFMFLGVPERQKRGAIHYHFMCNIQCGKEYKYYTAKGNTKYIILAPAREKLKLWDKEIKGYKYVDFYELPFWNMGFSSAFNLDMTDDTFNIAKYLSKYFWKNKDDSFFGRKKILRSLNLKKPLVEYLNNQDESYDLHKKEISEMVLLREQEILSRSKYCPDILVKEYKKNI